MRLVQQAQMSKSNTQVLADRAAGALFYVALGVAAATAVGWTLAVGWNLGVIERVATVLVIACPHALGLAIPLVVAITTSLGARNGILVRDRLALEEARLVDTVVFDKTGTLTAGEFGVVGIGPAEGWDGGPGAGAGGRGGERFRAHDGARHPPDRRGARAGAAPCIQLRGAGGARGARPERLA